MELKKIELNTFIPTLPQLLNYNFKSTCDYIKLFYDTDSSIITCPVNTPGHVKGSKGEFNQLVVDTLIVKNSSNIVNNTDNNSSNIDLINNLHTDVTNFGEVSHGPHGLTCSVLVDRYYYNIVKEDMFYIFNTPKIGTTMCITLNNNIRNPIDINAYRDWIFEISINPNYQYIIPSVEFICTNVVNKVSTWSILNYSPAISNIRLVDFRPQ